MPMYTIEGSEPAGGEHPLLPRAPHAVLMYDCYLSGHCKDGDQVSKLQAAAL